MRYLCALAAVAAIGWSLAYPQDALAVGWCGGGETATDVLPDAIGGDQIHVIYAYPSDGPDRFAELVGLIARDVDDVVRWWRSQDATRAPRFDLLRPACLDIASVRLTESAAQINSDVRYSAIARGLETVLADVHKKGLLYYDSPIPLGGPYCGEAAIAPDNGGPRAFAAVYLASNLNGWSGCGFLGAGH